MEMILLDWTRMGKAYCLAGAVAEKGGGWKFVRPLLAKHRSAPVRNVGWSAFLLDGHCRWEVFELVGPEPASPEPPHLEDVWVRTLLPRRRMATPAERRAVLEAGVRPAGEPAFGAPLSGTRAAAYLRPGTGQRSLATVLLPRGQLAFSVALRQGTAQPDCRVTLGIPALEGRALAVKDHFLLRRSEAAGPDPESRRRALTLAVAQMGDRVAVRLGLSRPYFPADNAEPSSGLCWLMADGFFSLADPQP